MKINQLLRNFPLILHVYFVSLKIISGCSLLYCENVILSIPY
nr:MAG TPA: hypothetical protein [Caudoviricetes sp.]